MQLDDDDTRFGEAILRTLGIPPESWFVCIHVREGGYSPSDEKYHSFRNANIASFIPAMKAIIDSGGMCVRMGDSTMSQIETIKGVVDYANSKYCSDRMDVFLCSRCRFFLGT